MLKEEEFIKESLSKGMAIDILPHLEDDHIFESLPVLGKLPSFVKYASNQLPILPVNNTFAYIILLYSQDSILNGFPMPELRERQQRSLELSKLNKEEYKNITEVYLTTLDSEDVLNMAFEYIIFQGNLDWEEIVAIERLRYNYLRSVTDNTALNDPAKLKNKSIILEEIKSMTSELKIRYHDFFAGDDKLISKGRSVAYRDYIEDRAK
jgi:hypothetical protein